jgi:hypothetical protein
MRWRRAVGGPRHGVMVRVTVRVMVREIVGVHEGRC